MVPFLLGKSQVTKFAVFFSICLFSTKFIDKVIKELPMKCEYLTTQTSVVLWNQRTSHFLLALFNIAYVENPTKLSCQGEAAAVSHSCVLGAP